MLIRSNLNFRIPDCAGLDESFPSSVETGYVTDHNLLLPAAGEAGTTANKTPENLLKDQFFGNNEIANSTADDIEQQPFTSSDGYVTSFLPVCGDSIFPRSGEERLWS